MDEKSILQKLLIMSKYALYCIVLHSMAFTFVLANNGEAQNKKLTEIYVSVNLQKTSLEEVLSEIGKKSDFMFVYNDYNVRKQKEVTLLSRNESLSNVLLRLSKDHGLKFKRVDKNIFVNRVKDRHGVMDGLVSDESSVDVEISGIITDETGVGLPGASIIEKGTIKGTTSDLDGKYKLSVSEDATVVISFVGYKTVERELNGQSTVDVQMELDAEQLDEVIVVGYGTQKKVNMTGAVSTVSGKAFENRPIASVGEGFQGLIPNLNISIPNGDPNSDIEFNIRGFESINGGSPLILVDNVPMDIQLIDPANIESISVLKDAAASAIYGARAAFGVILVTTKKGVKERTRIDYSMSYSLSKPIFHYETIDSMLDWVTWQNISWQKGQNRHRYTDAYVEAVRLHEEDPINNPRWGIVNGKIELYGMIDHIDIGLRDTSPAVKHNVSISGSTDKVNYYISGGYYNEKGLLNFGNTDFKRFNLMSKVDIQLADWISVEESITINAKKVNEPHFYSDVQSWNGLLIRNHPGVPHKFPFLEDYPQYHKYAGEPFHQTSNYFEFGGRDTFSQNDLWITTSINLNPINRLRVRATLSYNIDNTEDKNVASKVKLINLSGLDGPDPFHFGTSGSDFLENTVGNKQYYVFNAFTEYEFFEPTSIHYLKGMIGFNQEWNKNTFLYGRSASLINKDLPELSLTQGAQQSGGGGSELFLRGVFYRVNYSYDERYLFELNGRYDGTSRFPKDDRFGFFPSVSVGWRISNEDFMEASNNWLNNLKLRASFGTLGNQSLDSFYPYVSSLDVGTSNFIMSSGLIPSVGAASLVSPSLTWETVTTKNIGVDVATFDNRLSGSFDFYIRETKDMLLRSEFPHVLGTQAPQANGADLKTNGWELSLTWRDKISDEFLYDATFVLSDNQTEITKYNNPTGALSEYYVGQKIGDLWGYRTVGIFQTETEVAESADQTFLGNNWTPGDIRYMDVNGDGKIDRGSNTLGDHGDLVLLTNESPRLNFGINLNLEYKSFSLGMFFQGIFKRDYWPTPDSNGMFWPFTRNGTALKRDITDSWREDNRDAYFYSANRVPNKNQAVQTRFIQNASYIRAKNISLTYRMPEKFIGSVSFLQDMRIYIAAQNLFEFSGIDDSLDPEQISATTAQYPMQRVFSMGLNVSF